MNRSTLGMSRQHAAAKGKSEAAFREREVAVKECELELRRKELELKLREYASSRWRSPLVVAILGATLAALANVWVSYMSGRTAERVELLKWEQARMDEKKKKVGNAVTDLSKLLLAPLLADKALLSELEEPSKPSKISQVFALEDTWPKNRADVQALRTYIGTLDRSLYLALEPIIADTLCTQRKLGFAFRYLAIPDEPPDGKRSEVYEDARKQLNASIQALGPSLFEAYSQMDSVSSAEIAASSASGKRAKPCRVLGERDDP